MKQCGLKDIDCRVNDKVLYLDPDNPEYLKELDNLRELEQWTGNAPEKRMISNLMKHGMSLLEAKDYYWQQKEIEQYIKVGNHPLIIKVEGMMIAYGRKVCVEGRSMVNIIDVAEDLGYLHIPDGTLIETEAMKNYTPEQIVLITTGSQGESMAALSRMAANLHRKVSIQPGDCVVFSSTPIPGNEKSVARVINELGMKGAKVIFQDTHVSGHACQEEIKLVYSLLKPKYAIPVHGEYRHLIAQKEVAMSLGYDKEDVIIAKSGDVIELSDEKAAIVGKVHTGAILVDGLGVGDVGNIVLRDRQNLAENGIIIVVLTLEKYTGQLVAGPDIVTRGFVYVREAEELLDEARAIVTDSVLRCLDKNITDWSKIKNIIKDDLSEYLWKKMKRNPVILPIIMEAQM